MYVSSFGFYIQSYWVTDCSALYPFQKHYITDLNSHDKDDTADIECLCYFFFVKRYSFCKDCFLPSMGNLMLPLAKSVYQYRLSCRIVNQSDNQPPPFRCLLSSMLDTAHCDVDAEMLACSPSTVQLTLYPQ